MLDIAESKLFENIEDNDTASIKFYLETKGASRGYSPKMNLNVQNEQPLFPDVPADNSDK